MTATLPEIISFFKLLQDEICTKLEAVDGKAVFLEDPWTREKGGGGRSRVIQTGTLFEKGGVNFSHVYGEMPVVITQKLGLPDNVHFDATGVSIVIHPVSPHIPIIHMNVRYFQTGSGHHWFGGGIDLTPIYIIPEDATFFHQTLKSTCDKSDPTYYPKFKKWADDYFYIKHRKETRGVGGIFFDRLSAENTTDKLNNFSFVQNVGKTFLPAYTEIIRRHRDESYSKQEKTFQSLRRSRYVEFNLVYDKGTKFGLDTDGRTESILMSMPPHAEWPYNYQPEAGSREAFTMANLKPQDWV